MHRAAVLRLQLIERDAHRFKTIDVSTAQVLNYVPRRLAHVGTHVERHREISCARIERYVVKPIATTRVIAGNWQTGKANCTGVTLGRGGSDDPNRCDPLKGVAPRGVPREWGPP